MDPVLIIALSSLKDANRSDKMLLRGLTRGDTCYAQLCFIAPERKNKSLGPKILLAVSFVCSS